MLEKSYMEQLLREILRTNLDDPLVAALLLGANGELPDPDKLNVDVGASRGSRKEQTGSHNNYRLPLYTHRSSPCPRQW